ncbi:hypothetical protein HDU76_013142 [Blyttiomyces sp. JEL0837]|nr:hypothetical protein HDU76_013142 [Blyttiomyces sp. JEL0837]
MLNPPVPFAATTSPTKLTVTSRKNPSFRSSSVRTPQSSLDNPYMTEPTNNTQTLSLWDSIPNEVKILIVEHCDVLTRFLNNQLTNTEVESSSLEIWNLAIKCEYSGDLNTLPKTGFPTINYGLGHVTSKAFYQRLCQLRPDLTDISILKTGFSDDNKAWTWRYNSSGSPYERNMLFDRFLRKFLSDISNLLVHIPMRNLWLDDVGMHDCMTSLNKFKILFIAGYFGHGQLFRILSDETLKSDCKIYTPSMYNHILQVAASRGHTEIAETVLKVSGVDAAAEDEFGSNCAIRVAAANGHVDVVKLLLAVECVDPAAEGNWAIRFAAGNGHLAVVKMLVEVDGVDPTAENNMAIRYAATNGHAEVVRYLLGVKGVDATANDNEAMKVACRNRHAAIVKLLIENSNR